ncbi:MAG: glycosyltransferase, partial [Desulfurococcales archaeon]|nr:glycosyltransferase [Desulfurococcales archaeon]
ARYYNGALAAFIFRVDDFTVDPALSKRLPDSIADPGRWFENYQGLLVERVTGRYPWMRLVVGVITYCGSGNCSGGWRLCGTLASRYGWEVASHSRLHARPPRSAADYLGSIEDIEGNITGYRVLTYIEPFGKAGRGEVHALEERGVRVFMTTVPEPPWKPRAGEAYWRVGFTVKASSSLPWKPALQAALRAALVDGGVVVLYTHATSYDWRSPRDLLEAVDYTAGLLEGYQGLVWITTPGELYSYASEASRARVEARIEGDRVVVNVDYDGQPPGGRVWRVPITIEVNGLAPSMVEEVLVDGRAAPRLYGAISAPRPGYSWSGGRLLVSVYPPARVEIVVQPHARIALAPRGLIEGSRALGAARLLAYTIWLPFAAVVCTARRSGRLGLVAGQPGLAKRAGRVSTARYAVLIPARNAASTVGHALRSALAQTVKPVVVAVLDDASSDGTIQAAASVVERQGGVLESAGSTGSLDLAVYRLPSGVRVMLARFHQHTGKAGMVNAALRGPLRGWRFDYVLILDSDTVLEGRYAEKILHAMGSLGYSAANGLILLWKPDRPGAWARMVAGAFRLVGYLILALTVRVAESAVGALGGLNGAALMVERGMLESIGGLPTSTTADDAELTWRAHIGGYSVGIVPAAVA